MELIQNIWSEHELDNKLGGNHAKSCIYIYLYMSRPRLMKTPEVRKVASPVVYLGSSCISKST